jgi:hypothetical protein
VSVPTLSHTDCGGFKIVTKGYVTKDTSLLKAKLYNSSSPSYGDITNMSLVGIMPTHYSSRPSHGYTTTASDVEYMPPPNFSWLRHGGITITATEEEMTEQLKVYLYLCCAFHSFFHGKIIAQTITVQSTLNPSTN